MARSFIKDFMGGIDPTGTFTTQYGLADAEKSKRQQRARRMIGVTGGALGGAVTLPMAFKGISALALDAPDVVAARGFRALPGHVAREIISPIRDPYQAIQGMRTLKRLRTGKAPSSKDAARVKSLLVGLGNSPRMKEGLLRAGLLTAAENITPKNLSVYQELLKKNPRVQKLHGVAQGMLRSKLRRGLTFLALSGATAGTSSYLQHRLGSHLGKGLTGEQRKGLLK